MTAAWRLTRRSKNFLSAARWSFLVGDGERQALEVFADIAGGDPVEGLQFRAFGPGEELPTACM